MWWWIMNRWGTTYTVATAAVMCLGQNSLTEPIPIQTGFELYISSLWNYHLKTKETSQTCNIIHSWREKIGIHNFPKRNSPQLNVTEANLFRTRLTNFSLRAAYTNVGKHIMQLTHTEMILFLIILWMLMTLLQNYRQLT